MKILNLYAGIGGNRKLWGNEHEITAVELDERIAAIYADLFPNDSVIISDAHQYLLDHYGEFDFIWSSPPCPTHSRTNYFLNAQGVVRYADMQLYQEIILLQKFFKGKYCIENVQSYYEPLIRPQISGRHFFWTNFKIPNMKSKIKVTRMWGGVATHGESQSSTRKKELEKLGFNLDNYCYPAKEKLLRNCVEPEIGKAILDIACASFNERKIKQQTIFL